MKRIITLVALAFCVATPALSQNAHPSFAGKWSLDAAKSEPSPITPDSMTYDIQQQGDHLRMARTIVSASGNVSSVLTVAVDGKPWKNQWKQAGQDVAGISILSWDGPVLVIKSSVSTGGQDVQQTDRWSMGPAGKTVTIDRAIETQGQQLSTKLVLNRMP